MSGESVLTVKKVYASDSIAPVKQLPQHKYRQIMELRACGNAEDVYYEFGSMNEEECNAVVSNVNPVDVHYLKFLNGYADKLDPSKFQTYVEGWYDRRHEYVEDKVVTNIQKVQQWVDVTLSDNGQLPKLPAGYRYSGKAESTTVVEYRLDEDEAGVDDVDDDRIDKNSVVEKLMGKTTENMKRAREKYEAKWAAGESDDDDDMRRRSTSNSKKSARNSNTTEEEKNEFKEAHKGLKQQVTMMLKQMKGENVSSSDIEEVNKFINSPSNLYTMKDAVARYQSIYKEVMDKKDHVDMYVFCCSLHKQMDVIAKKITEICTRRNVDSAGTDAFMHNEYLTALKSMKETVDMELLNSIKRQNNIS